MGRDIGERRPGLYVVGVLDEPASNSRLSRLTLQLPGLVGFESQNFSQFGVVRRTSAPYKVLYNCDSMPSLRLKLLDAIWALYSEKEDWYTTRDVAMKAGVPTTTAKLKLENMHLLALLERDLDGAEEKAPYIWKPSKFLEDAQRVTNCLTNKIGGEGKSRKNK